MTYMLINRAYLVRDAAQAKVYLGDQYYQEWSKTIDDLRQSGHQPRMMSMNIRRAELAQVRYEERVVQIDVHLDIVAGNENH